MMHRFLLLALVVGFVSCATIGSPRNSVPFRVEVNVPDATVWVDDHLVGSVAVLARAGTFLRVGFHRVEIRHPDYYSFFEEVQPKSGENILIHADLHALVQ
ncbi:MAG TPA: hypothetical protein VGP07_25795 [Polyangia bacterium]|jgi:hypothetical protein